MLKALHKNLLITKKELQLLAENITKFSLSFKKILKHFENMCQLYKELYKDLMYVLLSKKIQNHTVKFE